MINLTKQILIVTLSVIVLMSCNKKEDSLNDYDLYSRLSRSGGTWQVESYEDFDNTTANPTKTTTEPKDDFFHFYRKSFEVAGNLIDIAVVTFYSGTASSTFDCEAEKERVVFRGPGVIFGGDVWTVMENKPNKQVWNYVNGSTVRVVTMKRCDCEFPDVTTQETKG